MSMNESSVNNNILSDSLLSYNTDQLIIGQLTDQADVDIYKFQTQVLPTASGVGFSAHFNIVDNFDPQAGWKISLLDNSGKVLSSLDTADVAGFAATGQLVLSSSYDSAKIAFVKVQASATNTASDTQYNLTFSQLQQISEDAVAATETAITGDSPHHGDFAVVGAVADTDNYVFETLAADSSSYIDFTYIDKGASVSVTLKDTGNQVINNIDNVGIEDASIIYGNNISFLHDGSQIDLNATFGIHDDNTVTLTLRHVDGSYALNSNSVEINALAVDFNSTLSIKPSNTASTNVNLTIGSITAQSTELTLRDFDGVATVDNDGTNIEVVNLLHGQSISFQASADATAYRAELTSTSSGLYSIQTTGLADRINSAPVLRVGDRVGSDYANIDMSAAALAELPSFQVTKTANLDLANVFKPMQGSGQLDGMVFMSGDSVPGIGDFNNSTPISAVEYLALAASQQINLSTQSIGSEFTIWGFATNQSTIADTLASGPGQYNASALMGAKFTVVEQGISANIADTTITEGQTSTLTLTLAQALVGDETLSITLKNSSGDLSFATEQVTFDASNQSIDVAVTAISGDADFSAAESNTIEIIPTSASIANLVVANVTVMVNESTPVFSLVSDATSVISDSTYLAYTVTLDNASEFTSSSANVNIAAPSGFLVSLSTNIADVINADIIFSSTQVSASFYVLADTTAVPDSAVQTTGLTGQITHLVNLGGTPIANAIQAISVTRAVIDTTSNITLNGTSVADQISGSIATEYFNALAGDDVINYVDHASYHQDSIDGGEGTDLVNLPDVQSNYTIVDEGNNSYTLDHNSHTLSLSNVEELSFNGGSTVALSSFNTPPVVSGSHGLTDADFLFVAGSSVSKDLSNLFTDAEGDAINLYITVNGSPAPGWIQYDSTNKTLSFDPTQADAGSFTLAISASDKGIPLNSPPTVSFALTVEGTNFNGTDSVDDSLMGSAYDDTIITHEGDNEVTALAGDDHITLGGGLNLVDAGAGNDTLVLESSSTWNSGYAAHNATIGSNIGTHQQVDIAGKNRFGNVIDAGPDIDTIILTNSANGNAFFLDDIYTGHHANATTTTINGFAAVARIINLEKIIGAAGNDIIDLTSDKFTLSHDVTLQGGAGDDHLWSANGADTLEGGDGNDTLFGGSGNDTLQGDAGADIYQFTASSGNDTIKGYDASEDKLVFFYRGTQHTSDINELSLTNGTLTWASGDQGQSVTILLDGITSNNFDDLGAINFTSIDII
jgi:hypothetical protein